MREFWKRRSHRIEARLAGRRERARSEFVQALADEVRPSARRRLAPSRVVLAAVLTLIMLAAVASVGGAGAGVSQQLVAVVKSVNNGVTGQSNSVRLASQDDDDDDGDDRDDGDDDDGDDDQYEEARLQCRRAAYQAFLAARQAGMSWRQARAALEEALGRCSEIGR